MTRTNMTVVPSDTPEPHQLHERVSLFNEDGSPYGKRVIFHGANNTGGALPVNANASITGPDYTLPWDNGTPYRASDIRWWDSGGDQHASWGPLNPGGLIWDMNPGCAYHVSAYSYTSPIDSPPGSTVFSTPGDFMDSRIEVDVIPDHANAWSASFGGMWKGPRFQAKVGSPGAIISEPFTISDYQQAKQHHLVSNVLTYDTTIYNNVKDLNCSGLVVMSCSASASILAETGFSWRFGDTALTIVEEFIGF